VNLSHRCASIVASLICCCISISDAAVPEAFAKLPEFESVRVSPNGDRLAVTMRSQNRVILNILRLSDMKSIGTFGLYDERDIEDVYWASNDRLLFGLAYRRGKNEAAVFTGDLMSVNVDGSEVRTLLGPDKDNLLLIDLNYRDWDIVDLLDADADHVLVSKYELTSPLPYLYRLNIKTGRKTRLLQSRYRYGDFMTDHKGLVRFQGGTERDGTYVMLYRDSEEGEWREIARYSTTGDDEEGGFDPIAFALDNKRIYFRDWRNGETSGLYLLDPEKGSEPELLFRDKVYDVGGLIPSRMRGVPIGVRWEAARTEWKYFEPHHPDVPLFESIRRAFAGQDVSIVSMSHEGSKAVLHAEGDVDPGTYYLMDLSKGTLLSRFPSRSWLQAKDLSPTEAIELTARDGLRLHGYLTRPKNAASGAKKKMVVLVHGGPIGVRDHWQFNPEVQWLAANGYAVLQVNFRGSGGYGPNFRYAGYGEWGAKMQDDVTDATLWAIGQGHADKSYVCIYGASYGAYSAMMGLVREPALYRCGIGYAGLYDLDLWQRDSMAASTPEGRAYQRAVVGKNTDELRRLSPTWRAEEIRAPVLLVHGGADRRTPVDQFKSMKAALEKAGKPTQTMFKKNEEHGFYNEANVAEFLETMINFLDQHMKD
jgi:dipeptidyl aminopeptidase/acylaminoacyl peptidase